MNIEKKPFDLREYWHGKKVEVFCGECAKKVEVVIDSKDRTGYYGVCSNDAGHLAYNKEIPPSQNSIVQPKS